MWLYSLGGVCFARPIQAGGSDSGLKDFHGFQDAGQIMRKERSENLTILEGTVMLRIDEKVRVPDLVETLASESGVFLVSAHDGNTLQIRLNQGSFMVQQSAYLPEEVRDDELW